MAWISLCELDELVDDKGKFVEIDGHQLAVFRQGEKVFALDNTCPHAGGPLADGWVEDGCCICPWHNWTFQLDTGQLKDAPGVKIHTYPTRVLERQGAAKLVQADLPMP